MSDKFLGQIMFSGYNFAPRGQAYCNGQAMPLAQNTALYALLGTMYGGDGRTNFALPDLRGRSPLGGYPSADGAWTPPSRSIGMAEGTEQETLAVANLPAHRHRLAATTTAATQSGPTAAVFATSDTPVYVNAASSLVALGATPSSATGGGQPHPNMQPFTVMTATIVIEGIYPSRD